MHRPNDFLPCSQRPRGAEPSGTDRPLARPTLRTTTSDETPPAHPKGSVEANSAVMPGGALGPKVALKDRAVMYTTPAQ